MKQSKPYENHDPIIDDFRAAIRIASSANGKSIPDFINNLYATRSKIKTDPSGKSDPIKYITLDLFEAGISSERSIKLKLTKSDIQEIFEQCNTSGSGEVPLSALIDLCTKDSSSSKILALKLRAAIIKSYNGINDYKSAFNSLIVDKVDKKYADLDAFHEFVEQHIEGTRINETDNLIIYSIFDVDGDGKVSLQDFLSFLNEHADATTILEGRSPEVIVDIKVSNSREMDAELLAQKYIHISPDSDQSKGSSIESLAFGSFGKGQSIWIWRRKMGTCSGRLKPIISIQLESTNVSTSLVVAGFTCLNVPISGQYVWIRRAESVEEEKDALLDIRVSIGKAKIPTDRIYQAPGPGWSKIEGANFGKGLFSSNDAFLWYLPARARIAGNSIATTVRSYQTLGDNSRRARLCKLARNALRNYVPVSDMSKESNTDATAETLRAGSNPLTRSTQFNQAKRFSKFASLSYITGKFNEASLGKMLRDIGICVDPSDVGIIFYHFDVDIDGYITNDEFLNVLALTDYELDCSLENMKKMLLPSPSEKSKKSDKDTSSSVSLRSNRALTDIFAMANALKDGVLSYEDIASLMSKLEIFLDELEIRRAMKLMDGGDDRIEEKDFLNFMKKESQSDVIKAKRLLDCATLLRSWISRHSTSSDGTLIQKDWADFKRAHEKITKAKFPGFLTSEDLYLILARNGVRLSDIETRQLAFIVAPEKNGRINQADMANFSKGKCRSFGEILALLDRDIMEPAINIYRKHREAIKKDGVEDPEAALEFQDTMKIIVDAIKAAPTGDSKKGTNVSTDIVSIIQIKQGIEHIFEDYKTPASLMITMEEWAALACMTGDAVVDDGVFGVHISEFIHKICYLIAGRIESIRKDDVLSLQAYCRELQIMLREEAKKTSKNKAKLDYLSSFMLFDLNGTGTIDKEEFKKMLVKLRMLDGLSENDHPKLLAEFDKSKKGYITLEDFIDFAENGKYGLENEGIEDDEDDNDLYGIASNTPPVAITRIAETDWLLWFVWKEAFKLDKSDPEGVVNELEAVCQETEITKDKSSASTVTSNDFWLILVESKLKGTMSRSQFDSGIKQFTDFDKKNGDKVDYVAFCHNVVRMGRAFNSIMQEKKKKDDKKYAELKGKLHAELKYSGALEVSGRPGQESLRFQKVMRRLDEDGDGQLSVAEFKMALKRVRLRCEKDWNSRMIRRLFDEFDKNRDGLLDTEEFMMFISASEHDHNNHDKNSKDAKPNEDFEEDEDHIFKGRKIMSEHDLFKKVSVCLQEMVPSTHPSMGDRNLDLEEHLENVRAAVRRFFQRSDPRVSGIVPEERFRAFCRKSGLHDNLSAGEIRRVIDTIRRKKGNDIHFVDYERFCRLLGPSALSIPYSRAEAVVKRLQDVALASNSAGRSFLALCSLIDQKFTGKLSKDELIHTIKMMGGAVNTADIEAIQELMPDSAVSRDGMIDYREVNWILENYTGNLDKNLIISNTYRIDTSSTPRPSMNHSSSLFNSPGRGPGMNASHEFGRTSQYHDTIRNIIPTPSGQTVSTPYSGYVGRENHTLPPYNHGASVNAYEKMLTAIVDRTAVATEDKSKSWGSPFSLLRQFEVFDSNGSGLVSLRSFQSTLDEIRVFLSASEIHAIQTQLGRPNDDRIDYIKFCKMLDQTMFRSGAKGRRDYDQSVPYLNYKVIDRFLVLRREGRDPRDMFEAYDLDRLGMVNVKKFKETILKLDLLQSEHQLARAMEDFSNLTDRSMIHYDDFCKSIENEARNYTNLSSSYQTFGRIDNFQDENSFTNNGRNHQQSSHNFSSSKDNFTFTPRFRSSLESERDQDFPHLKLSSSATFQKPMSGRSRYGEYDWDTMSSSFERSDIKRGMSHASPRRPRSPPSKVGAAIWGSGTPLVEKGQPLEVGNDRWCCPVCFYTENLNKSDICELCDCPNMTKKSDYQVKEQCSNCTFLNGRFASECEMCQKPLSNLRSKSVLKEKKELSYRY